MNSCSFLRLINTADEFLVNYYKTNLKFKESDNGRHGTAKPLYDLGCKFMYQPTVELEDNRSAFFDSFNPDEDAV